ncbi:MAG: hypothetical protein AAGE86_02310 [Pseudomonadota bacterium]
MPRLRVSYHPLSGEELPQIDDRVDTFAPVRAPMVGLGEEIDFSSGPAEGIPQGETVSARAVTDTDCWVGVTDEPTAPALNVTNAQFFPAAALIEDFTVPTGHRLVTANA